MTTEREMLECAAKSCGFKKWRMLTSGFFQVSNNENWNEAFAKWTGWNPLTNPDDTAEMCARLEISTLWLETEVRCDLWMGPEVTQPHDGTDEGKLKAWMLAATSIAAKIGGMK